jgi:hypothetical protein
MRGMALEYPFVMLVAFVVIIVVIGIVATVLKGRFVPEDGNPIDVRYACSNLNNSQISYDNFKTLIYGFFTEQCKNFVGELKETVTFEDMQRAVQEIDEKIKIVKISECSLPTVSARTLYVCCGEVLEKNKVINIIRKEIKNSDVLICVME